MELVNAELEFHKRILLLINYAKQLMINEYDEEVSVKNLPVLIQTLIHGIQM